MAFIISSLIVQGVYTGLIGGISTITLSTCGMVRSIYTHKNPNVNNLMTELDIERRLKLIETVLNVKEANKKPEIAKVKLNDLEKTVIFEIVKGDNDKCDDPIELCLTYLHRTIQDIHNNLTEINKKVAYHKTKWFSSWRTLNVKRQMEALKINSTLLDSRFNDLIKISQFLNSRN